MLFFMFHEGRSSSSITSASGDVITGPAPAPEPLPDEQVGEVHGQYEHQDGRHLEEAGRIDDPVDAGTADHGEHAERQDAEGSWMERYGP